MTPGLSGSEYSAVRLRRNKMFADIQQCRACERRTIPPPKIGSGSIPNERMLLTDTPGNGCGDYLSGKLVNAGLPPLTRWYVTSTVKCRTTTPETLDIQTCHRNIRQELAVVDPKWVVLLGSHALTSVGVKAQVTKVHGRPFIPPYGPFVGRICFPTFHPDVIFKSEHNALLLTQDLSTLYGLMSGRVNLSSIEARVGRSGTLDLTVEV